eukprot:jgi/Bigna1/91785/estExt_fgenesh1_pg.C_1190014
MASEHHDKFQPCVRFLLKLYNEQGGDIVYSTVATGASKGTKTGRQDLLDENGEPGLGFVAHALQTAQNAKKAGYEEEVQVAALLHDVGWLLPKPSHEHRSDQLTSADSKVWLAKHDKVGADFLRQLGFSERTAKLVEGHVQAKRYLCFSEEEYYSKLSAGSKFTLKHQGALFLYNPFPFPRVVDNCFCFVLAVAGGVMTERRLQTSQSWLQYDDMLSAPLKNIRVEDKKTKDSMQWKSVEIPRGGVLIYGNMMPHMSEANKSNKNRRALFPIYCDKESVGVNARDKYYRWEAQNRRKNNSALCKGKANRFFMGKAIQASS